MCGCGCARVRVQDCARVRVVITIILLKWPKNFILPSSFPHLLPAPPKCDVPAVTDPNMHEIYALRNDVP